jgi:hypothetical protein
MNPAKAEAVWRAICRHKPSSQMDEPPQTRDNVVELGQRHGGSG